MGKHTGSCTDGQRIESYSRLIFIFHITVNISSLQTNVNSGGGVETLFYFGQNLDH
jgi:hypothetical protein